MTAINHEITPGNPLFDLNLRWMRAISEGFGHIINFDCFPIRKLQTSATEFHTVDSVRLNLSAKSLMAPWFPKY